MQLFEKMGFSGLVHNIVTGAGHCRKFMCSFAEYLTILAKLCHGARGEPEPKEKRSLLR